ncbi:MAG: hypothetical protein M3032_07265 [Verrucomicrobiota bacterium]|nr:hypothetical protein [Verrucomicrobiota bacterium]
MKIRQLPFLHYSSLSASALFSAAVLLAATFWFASSSTATPGLCQVCHKRTQTFTFQCNSVQYAGHKGHGDPDGPCQPTPIADDGGGKVIAPVDTTVTNSGGALTTGGNN